MFYATRQGQVEVLSAEQQVITDGCPLELNVAASDVRPHQAKIRGATTDVADQHQVAILHLRRNRLPMSGDPGVEGGQRFFKKCQPIQARLARQLPAQPQEDQDDADVPSGSADGA